ncbi:MAG: hypothetical protein ALAOOOJD_03784 [bacterium]|nr:hypothetical protein [bacterium]
MPDKSNFPALFKELKSLLQKYEFRLTVTVNKTDAYSLDGGFSEKFKRMIFFGSVQIKKNYVSYYLMPVYMFPELLQSVSAELKKRMQGKSCFNFTAADAQLFRELAQLTKKGFDKFKQEKLLVKS